MYQNYLKVKKSKRDTGEGLFTEIDIPANRPIIEKTGEVRNKENLEDINHPAWLQVSNYLFIGPSGGKDDYINHSCDPNCYFYVVGKRAILYSLYDIREGSELTFDYSTTSTKLLDEWQMECKCKSSKCRKMISGYQSLPKELKKEYEDKGIVAAFIINPLYKRI